MDLNGQGWRCIRGLALGVALSMLHSGVHVGSIFAQTRPIQPEPVQSGGTLLLPPSAAGSNPAQQATTGGGTAESSSPAAAAPANPDETPSEAVVLKQNADLRLEQLQSDTERTPELKSSLTKVYQQVSVDASAAEQARNQRLTWSQLTAAAAQQLENAKAQKEKLGKSSPIEEPRFDSFEDGQALEDRLEAELATATTERNRLTEQIANRDKRRKELPQLISDAKTQLEQLTKTIAPPATEGDPLTNESLQWADSAARLALTEQIAALESEQRAYEAESALLPLQLELAQAAEKRLQERLTLVGEQLTRIRQDRILSKRSDLTALAKTLPPELEPRAQAILERIGVWLTLSAKHASVKHEFERSKAVFERWKTQQTTMESRINPRPGSADTSGFNSWVALTLRRQRDELPNPSKLAASLRGYQADMQFVDSLLFELDDALAEIQVLKDEYESDDSLSFVAEAEESAPELESELELTLEPSDAPPIAGPPAAGASSTNDAENAKKLFELSEEVIAEMKLDARAYVTDLLKVADIKQQTQTLSESYRNLIDKQILWIRSCERLNRTDAKLAVDAFTWLVEYKNWRELLGLVWNDIRTKPWWYVFFGIGFIVLAFRQRRLRTMIGEIGAKTEKKNCTAFGLTARAIVMTFLIVVPVPLLLLFLYWRIASANEIASVGNGVANFSKSVASGLLVSAALFFPLELLRQICRPTGLGVKHFGWDKAVAKLLARNLRWLIDLSIPACFIIAIFDAVGDSRWEASLGRIAFILLMPILSLFWARVFAPRSGILGKYLEKEEGGWIDRLRYLWYPGLIIGPLALAFVSFIGYHYTAMRIASHLNDSLWSAVLLLVAYCAAKRWLLLNRRKLMIAQARQRLEEAAKRDTQDESEVASPLKVEKADLDLTVINEQTKRLLVSVVVAVGLVLVYVIWSDILPAISFLDNFTLWDVEGAQPDKTVRITLANLVLVVPIIVLLFVAGRNVPGLLEIAFLQHLPLTNAARYAITTLTRYFIIGVGIVLSASTLGLKWSSIQWLVAALGVGLGFGLQEIFANFVSGVILLFEQPIRVGDIITIDGTTGTVLKIRMRATTILNWDRQELVVPNKDLITGKLLNWTLTDSTNRIVVNVGVAYGADTVRACEIIREICDEHPNILQDPTPIVTFEGFGDNSLSIVIRAYLERLDGRLQTIHTLHQLIYTALNEAKIEIAFPQRDIHIRTLPNQLQGWLSRQVDPDEAAVEKN